jgi:tRNA(Ile)-lysidine synthase
MLLDDYWLKKLNKYKKIKVGLSCGLDSSVLIHNLASYDSFHAKIEAIHVNHGLSPNAHAWQAHCEKYCQALNIPLLSQKVEISAESHIEETARNARYSIFLSILQENECLVLAHHQNDKVETLLFNLFRGTGIDGLASIPESRKLGMGEIVRPLLNVSRDTLYQYALEHNIDWLEDESNFNLDFSRNYIRHNVLPVITAKWPSALQNMSDCALKCDTARDNLLQLALIDCPKVFSVPLQLDLDFIKYLPYERLVNVLRSWLKYNEISSPSSHIYQCIIKEVIFARQDKVPKIVLGKVLLTRYRNCLYIVKNILHSSTNVPWTNFPSPLHLADGRMISAEINENGLFVAKNAYISVGFRVGGECIEHNGKNKKLKKLLQDLAVLPWEREFWPLLFVNGKLQAVIGLLNADSNKHDDGLRYVVKVS